MHFCGLCEEHDHSFTVRCLKYFTFQGLVFLETYCSVRPDREQIHRQNKYKTKLQDQNKTKDHFQCGAPNMTNNNKNTWDVLIE